MGIVSVITRVLNNESIMRDLYINEPVLESGWYYSDEAKVPGTENATLNEGHVIVLIRSAACPMLTISPRKTAP